jgi:ADP-heptose:LPS heptosyltransferase
VFFCGLGDYLYSTPAIEHFKKNNKHVKIYGCVSSSLDTANNPLLGELLKRNPNIDEVVYYEGKAKRYWKSYDFHKVKDSLPKDCVVYPVLYDLHISIKHRVTTLLKVFGVKEELPVPRPNIYLFDDDYNKANAFLKEHSLERAKKIVFLHLEARSSNYKYDQPLELIKGLIAEGYKVVYLTSENDEALEMEGCYKVFVKEWNINESMALIKLLKDKAYFICINSVFFPVTSALGIKTLALYIFDDISAFQFFYPNLYFVTPYKSLQKRLPCTNYFSPQAKDFIKRENLYYYQSNYIIEAFKKMISA